MLKKICLFAGLACFLGGCGPSTPTVATTSAPASKSPLTAVAGKGVIGSPIIMAEAGLPVKTGDATLLTKTAALTIPSRGNPFALTPSEASYERAQLAANLATMGSFPMYYQAPAEVITTPQVEQQPYRRLAGILIGDSVTALIDMGNGSLQEIHPGQRIQGTEWMVVSIDSEKAVLRRVGSRKVPQEVIVRLESAPSGAAPLNVPGQQPTNAPNQPQQPRGRGRLGGGAGGGGD